jgi:hypothetical protein
VFKCFFLPCKNKLCFYLQPTVILTFTPKCPLSGPFDTQNEYKMKIEINSNERNLFQLYLHVLIAVRDGALD